MKFIYIIIGLIFLFEGAQNLSDNNSNFLGWAFLVIGLFFIFIPFSSTKSGIQGGSGWSGGDVGSGGGSCGSDSGGCGGGD